MTQVAATDTRAPSAQARWRKFSASTPLPHEIVEIRRMNDDKTILRARAELPPCFDWRRAEWRPL